MPSYFQWRYVVEVPQDNDWVWVDSYDDMESAIKDADSRPSARVRQFKTTIFTESKEATVSNLTTTDSTVPVIPFFCPSHPSEKAQALKTSEPLCKECHKPMFQGAGVREL